MKSHRPLLLLLVLILLAACGQTNKTLPAIVSTHSSASLNQTGPWLMVYNRVDRGWGFEQNLLIDPIFTNADGSAWEPANLPFDPALDEPEPRMWSGQIASKRPFLALREDLNLVMHHGPYTPTCSKDADYRPNGNGKYNTLYILKLPDNKIINHFQLFGEKAIAQFRKEECAYAKKGSEELPPVLGSVLSSSNFQWSPDGHYLAFAAAPDFAFADLYLYDTKNNTFRRLTTRQNNPYFIHWSQDGKSIIYNSTTKMSVSLEDQWESRGVYNVSLAGRDEMLFASKDYPYWIGWYSPTQFIIEDGFCDAWGSGLCTTNVRLVDLSTGKNAVIYNDPQRYLEFAVDPIHQILLIKNPPGELLGEGENTPTPDPTGTQQPNLNGVYQFDLNTHKVKQLLDGDINVMEWNPKYQAFRIVINISSDPSDLRAILLSFEPGKGWIEKPDDIFILSPDGQWSIREGLILADNRGNEVQKVQDLFGCFSPNSDWYAEMIHDYDTSLGQLLIYSKQTNWQPEVVHSINTDQFWLCEWISP